MGNSALPFSVSELHPKVVGTGGLTLFPDTVLFGESREGLFEPLDEKGLMEELLLFVENLDFGGRFITHHTSSMDLNTMDFGRDKGKITEALRYEIEHGDIEGKGLARAVKRGLRRRKVRFHGLLYIKDMELSGMDVSGAAGRWMAAIVLAVAVMAFLVPETGLWIRTGWINYLLMAVMFGMGLTISPQDFKVVFTRPRDVAVGCIAQFTVMPLLAYVLCAVFGLEAGLMAGVILVGACPGGTASNVITLFSKGDVPLSVGMTVVNTILAPVVTPLLVYLALHESIDFDILHMFLSIVQVVIIPIALGFAISHFFGKQTEKAKDVLPVVSLAAISLIVMCVVSHSVGLLKDCGITVFAVVVLHNLLGYVCGYTIAILFRMPEARKRALSIEVGMQNSGLATSLAATSFPSLAMATVPGAVFSVWHNISGALLAAWYSRHDVGKKNERMRSPRTCRRR